jgi:hypothetical protein
MGPTNENTGLGEFETLSVPCQTVATAYEQSMFELTETSRFALTKMSFFLSQKKTDSGVNSRRDAETSPVHPASAIYLTQKSFVNLVRLH